MPQAPMTRSGTADLDTFEGIVDMKRLPNGKVALQKLIDFSHPKAPAAFDVLSRARSRGQVAFISFVVTDHEAYVMHRSA